MKMQDNHAARVAYKSSWGARMLFAALPLSDILRADMLRRYPIVSAPRAAANRLGEMSAGNGREAGTDD